LGKQKPFAGLFGNWLCLSWWCQSWWLIMSVLLLVSWWSFNCVSVVVGVLVALRRCVHKSWRFSWCFESCSCFRGVPVLFWRCSGGALVVLKKRYFFWVKWFPGQYQISVNGDVRLSYWGCRVNVFFGTSDFPGFFGDTQKTVTPPQTALGHITIQDAYPWFLPPSASPLQAPNGEMWRKSSSHE
jgi:hypothetical protein